MRFLRTITIGTGLLLAQFSAFGAEMAVLKNGFSIRFDHKEQTGSLTRLYTGTGYVDIATDQIASFEAEEAPVAPPPETAAAPANAVSSAAPAVTSVVPSMAKPAAVQPAAMQLSPKAVPVASSAAPSPAGSSQPAVTARATVDLDEVIREASRKNRLDPDFVSSVIKAESNFKTTAVSKKGARGLMQLMPATASQLGLIDPFDPRANVEAGAAHLSALLDQYHDDPIKALAAYNAGAHRVKQYNGVPPYRETRNYISKIVRDFNAKKRAQMKAAQNAGPKKSPVAPVKASTPSRKNKPEQAGISKHASPA